MTNDWKKAFFEIAQIAFEESSDESFLDKMLAIMRKQEDQEVVIDFLERIVDSNDFPEETHEKLVADFIARAKKGAKAEKELLQVYAEIQAREIRQRERGNTGKLGITVRNVAKDIVKANPNDYSKDLLQLIPKEILDIELTNDNLHEIGKKINGMRLQKEKELSALFQGVTDGKEKQKLEEIINGDGKGLNELQLNKIKDIKFLNKLAVTIIQL